MKRRELIKSCGVVAAASILPGGSAISATQKFTAENAVVTFNGLTTGPVTAEFLTKCIPVDLVRQLASPTPTDFFTKYAEAMDNAGRLAVQLTPP